jgi:hypothetical protein
MTEALQKLYYETWKDAKRNIKVDAFSKYDKDLCASRGALVVEKGIEKLNDSGGKEVICVLENTEEQKQKRQR